MNSSVMPVVDYDPVSNSELGLNINTATGALVGCRCFRASVVGMTLFLALDSPRRSRVLGVGAPLGMGAGALIWGIKR